MQIKAEYQRRRMCLYTKAFEMGKGAAEVNCIAVLKQLVIGEHDYFLATQAFHRFPYLMIIRLSFVPSSITDFRYRVFLRVIEEAVK